MLQWCKFNIWNQLIPVSVGKQFWRISLSIARRDKTYDITIRFVAIWCLVVSRMTWFPTISLDVDHRRLQNIDMHYVAWPVVGASACGTLNQAPHGSNLGIWQQNLYKTWFVWPWHWWFQKKNTHWRGLVANEVRWKISRNSLSFFTCLIFFMSSQFQLIYTIIIYHNQALWIGAGLHIIW